MDNRDIIEKVLTEKDSFQIKSSSELREILDDELSKPDVDYGLVDELAIAVIEAEGKERLTADVDAELNKLHERTSRCNRTIHLPKWIMGLSAACVILFCVNCISVSAWDMNIISAVVEFTKGGFSVDFQKNKSEIIELPVSEDDPYGIITECAKYDIYPETPHYIPDGFALTNIDTNINEDYANTIHFVYKNGNQDFSIVYTKYWNEIWQIGIPSDHYNISETEVNGNTAIISKEDNQYTITFMNEKTLFFMFARNVPYDECEEIVASIR